MTDDDTLRAYYEARAPWYDQAYQGDPPPWVADIVADLQSALRGRSVLEIACGTGQWTRHAARVAASVTAIDSSPAMRTIAVARLATAPHVTVGAADAYTLDGVPRGYTGGLAMQWISHVPTIRRDAFFRTWHARLAPDAVVFLGDNQLTGDWAGKQYRRTDSADLYEEREVPGGPPYYIVKNYFTENELREMVAPYGTDVRVVMGERWWWLSYRLAGRDTHR